MNKFIPPKFYMDAYNYAWDYVKNFNKEAEILNDILAKSENKFKLKYRTLDITFWMDCDLRNDNCIGQYIADGISSTKSPTGLIKIDIRRIGNWEKIKETIRHEIAHAIAHQIDGCNHNGHNNKWILIAKEHNVNIDNYLK